MKLPFTQEVTVAMYLAYNVTLRTVENLLPNTEILKDNEQYSLFSEEWRDEILLSIYEAAKKNNLSLNCLQSIESEVEKYYRIKKLYSELKTLCNDTQLINSFENNPHSNIENIHKLLINILSQSGIANDVELTLIQEISKLILLLFSEVEIYEVSCNLGFIKSDNKFSVNISGGHVTGCIQKPTGIVYQNFH